MEESILEIQFNELASIQEGSVVVCKAKITKKDNKINFEPGKSEKPSGFISEEKYRFSLPSIKGNEEIAFVSLLIEKGYNIEEKCEKSIRFMTIIRHKEKADYELTRSTFEILIPMQILLDNRVSMIGTNKQGLETSVLSTEPIEIYKFESAIEGIDPKGNLYI